MHFSNFCFFLFLAASQTAFGQSADDFKDDASTISGKITKSSGMNPLGSEKFASDVNYYKTNFKGKFMERYTTPKDSGNDGSNEKEDEMDDINYERVSRDGTVKSVAFDSSVVKNIKKFIYSLEDDSVSTFEVGDDYKCKVSSKTNEKVCRKLKYRRDIFDQSSERSRRFVFGSDDRRKVENTRRWPFRAAGKVGDHCSGTLVGPRHVLTAGHCVHSGKDGDWLDDLNFYPGHDSASSTKNPYGTYSWKHAYSVSGWTKKGKAAYDYAIIELHSGPGHYMSFGTNDGISTNARRWSMNLNGYPGDEWSEQYHHYGKLLAVKDKCFHYRGGLDIVKGTSGSGVYRHLPAEGSRVIYGINNWQYWKSSDAKPRNDHFGSGHTAASYNHAVRITPVRFGNLCGWIGGNRC